MIRARCSTPILELHERVRDEVVAATERQHVEALAAVDRDTTATRSTRSTSSEKRSSRGSPTTLAREHSFVLVAEGLPGGRRCYPEGGDEASADWWIIVDPIDGTRGLMYQKRSAWVLTGVAPNRGRGHVAARRRAGGADRDPAGQAAPVGSTVGGARRRRAGASLQPADRRACSDAPARRRRRASIAHGFAIDRRGSFPARATSLPRSTRRSCSGRSVRTRPGKAHCFEDQYASTGGQLYELMAGHDRFIADLRPLLRPVLQRRGLPPALTCHPYDVCCALIAEESGVIVTDPRGATARCAAERRRRRRVGRLRERADPRADRAVAAAGAARARLDRQSDDRCDALRSTRSPICCALRPVRAGRADLSRARARPARRDGRHRRLLRLARSRAADRRSDLGRDPADRRARCSIWSASVARRWRSRSRHWLQTVCRSAMTRRDGCSATANRGRVRRRRAARARA